MIGVSGLVPNDGHFPPATGGQSELMVTGPLCRYAEDLAPVLRIMAGPNVSRLKLDSEVNGRFTAVHVFNVYADCCCTCLSVNITLSIE